MNQLLENRELQNLLRSLEDGESIQKGQPLGKYGRIAMKFMHESNLQRFMLLKMTGELIDMMYRVDSEASEMVEMIMQQMIERDPMPKTDDILERTRHLNKHKSVAEELAIKEIVMVLR